MSKKKQKHTTEEIARIGLAIDLAMSQMDSAMKQAAKEMRRFNQVYVQMHERVELGLSKDGKPLTVRRNGSDVKDVMSNNKPC